MIHIENVDQITDKSLAQIMEELLEIHPVPKEKQMLLFTHLRLAHNFSDFRKRLLCVQARLQALSIITYCSSVSMFESSSNNILYNGFIEELVEVLELKDSQLLDIKAAALRTLTSVIHLDHTNKLNSIIDVFGASSYHGFLPTLVRSCIQALINGDTTSFPLNFATPLFSFLYHLASYESGGEALVSCGMLESLLKIISWKGSHPEHLTFVTRAIRVIDLITNLDMSGFQNHGGLNIFIQRLEYEIDFCRKEQPFEIEVSNTHRRESQDVLLNDPVINPSSPASLSSSTRNELTTETSDAIVDVAQEGDVNVCLRNSSSPMEVDTSSNDNSTPGTSSSHAPVQSNATNLENNSIISAVCSSSKCKEPQIYSQRAAVIKALLNFIKKAIQDSAFSDSIRHLMDGPLPKCLRHMISNAEYYGSPLFMVATDIVSVYVFQEPSLLSSLQESGLTDVVLHSLLVKEVNKLLICPLTANQIYYSG